MQLCMISKYSPKLSHHDQSLSECMSPQIYQFQARPCDGVNKFWWENWHAFGDPSLTRRQLSSVTYSVTHNFFCQTRYYAHRYAQLFSVTHNFFLLRTSLHTTFSVTYIVTHNLY